MTSRPSAQDVGDILVIHNPKATNTNNNSGNHPHDSGQEGHYSPDERPPNQDRDDLELDNNNNDLNVSHHTNVNNSSFSYCSDPNSCGCMPRVIKTRLLGSPNSSWSIDINLNPTVMCLSILIIWSFVIWCAVDDKSGETIGEWQTWIVRYWTWFYVSSVVLMSCFILFLYFSRFGNIKLSPVDKLDEAPRFSLGSWFAMLFSAGIGVGLYFYGVAEPVLHYYDSKNGNNRYYTDGDNLERALDALNISVFHLGLTGSAIYCIVGLPLAYFAHVKGKPLKLSAAFEVLLGESYANGFIGDLIDTMAAVGTMFGISTSLGLGVIQLNAFLNFMAPKEFEKVNDTDLRVGIIWIITAFATISVFTGLDVGIRRLSEWNYAFGLILMFYLFFIVDPFYTLNLFVQTCGYHLQYILEITFFTDSFQQAGFTDGNYSYENFMSWWTVFYWGWWIAWSPFVGIFIAQISRGRTIKEFILGNVLAPTLMTTIWLAVFGGIGLYSELAFDDMSGNAATTGTVDCSDASTYYKEYKGTEVAYLECFALETMLFEMIDRLPLGSLMNILAGIGLVTYFVTSSDSASHVIDMLTANGNTEPPKIQRVFWALSEGAVASVLLSVGGEEALRALQTVSIASGLPFCAILLCLCYAFYYALKVDRGEIDSSNEVGTWSINFWDSINPQITCLGYENPATGRKIAPKTEYLVSWARGLICPCIGNWINYNNANEKDIDNQFFSESMPSRVFWSVMLLGPAQVVFIFCMVGIAYEGWAYLGLVFYLFYVFMNGWQRARIRSLYKIEGNICCDILAHLLCCAAWAIVQEEQQIKNGIVGGIAREDAQNVSKYNLKSVSGLSGLKSGQDIELQVENKGQQQQMKKRRRMAGKQQSSSENGIGPIAPIASGPGTAGALGDTVVVYE